MNMHGFISPSISASQHAPSRARRAVDWIRSHRPFMLIVVLPVLIASTYLYLFAAAQYETEAHFVVQTSDGQSASAASFGDILGLSAPMSPTQSQAMGISDYLVSQEAVNALQQKLNLVSMFRRPEADVMSRLHPADPAPESLLSYYEGKVFIHYDRDTGISTLQVRAFRPTDSYAIINELLDMSERRINQLNERSYRDAVSSAQVQVAEAERNSQLIERQMTAYRQGHEDINPTATGQAQTTMIAELTGNLAAARAQFAQMNGMVTPSSPQYRAMASRVQSLQREVARQNSALTGGSGTIASRLGGYEELKIRQEFAGKRYDSAAASLEKAREQARRQSLYLLRVVNPTVPVKSLYPQRGRVVLTVLIALLVAYSIGWLIVAGVHEHSI